MDTLTADDVAAFRDPVRRLCADRFDRATVRESGQPVELDRGVWKELCDIGVIGALVPESCDGLDLGVRVAAALWEECGLGLAPGPLTWSALAAVLVPGVADGTILVTGGLPLGDDLLVEHGAQADALLLLGDDDVQLVDLAAWSCTSCVPSTRARRFSLTAGPQIGEPRRDRRRVTALRSIGAVLSAAYLVGLSRLALDARHAARA